MAVLSRTRYNICYNTLVIGRRDYREILCTLEVERSSAARPCILPACTRVTLGTKWNPRSMFASPRSALGLRRSLVRSKNSGKESPGTGTRPGQTDRHYKCHPSQHKHQELSAQSHVSLFQFTALTHRVSSTAPITARRTRPSSPWRPC